MQVTHSNIKLTLNAIPGRKSTIILLTVHLPCSIDYPLCSSWSIAESVLTINSTWTCTITRRTASKTAYHYLLLYIIISY